jgi:5-methyltetrahydropteroyltriglutamate--homocysteine methyltransferase
VKRSEHAILTTHCGSLPRADALRTLLLDRDAGLSVEPGTLDAAVRQGVADVVRRQVEAGITVVNDGEQSKVGFAAYVTERLSGFDGPPAPRPVTLDARDFPEWAARRGDQTTRPACNGPVGWRDFSAVERDIANLKAALNGVQVEEAFLTAASPGTITNHHPNLYYPSREQYLDAVAETMKREYDAIAAAGFLLQIDCPDIGLHNTWFPDLTLAEFQREITRNVEALNYAVREIDPDRVRVHVCWGAGEGPHNHDPELRDILDIVVKASAGAISIVGANGRHEHEWRLWKGRLPDGKTLIPGVVDNTTNIIEHPEVVADRIVNYASVVGRENVIAGVDCGFATSLTRAAPAVDPKVAWAKLRSLAEGAALASKTLWA